MTKTQVKVKIQAKICGLNDSASVNAAVEGGAAYIGMVFFERSPRAVTPKQAASLTKELPTTVKTVGLFVDPDDALIQSVLDEMPLDVIQLHGAETPGRVQEIRGKFGTPVMKAIKIAEKADFEAVKAYEAVADMLLFDAKAPKTIENALPGGNGLVFDWRMLKDLSVPLPWMLAGGLDINNVRDAVTISGASCVDTSSGVEIEPGQKDPAAILSFLKEVYDI